NPCAVRGSPSNTAPVVYARSRGFSTPRTTVDTSRTTVFRSTLTMSPRIACPPRHPSPSGIGRSVSSLRVTTIRDPDTDRTSSGYHRAGVSTCWAKKYPAPAVLDGSSTASPAAPNANPYPTRRGQRRSGRTTSAVRRKSPRDQRQDRRLRRARETYRRRRVGAEHGAHVQPRALIGVQAAGHAAGERAVRGQRAVERHPHLAAVRVPG